MGITGNFEKPPQMVLQLVPGKKDKIKVKFEKKSCYVEEGEKKYFFAEITDNSKVGDCPTDITSWKTYEILNEKPVDLFEYIKQKKL